MHNAAILAAENKALRAENTRQKRKRAQRRTTIAEGGIFTIQEGQDMIRKQELVEQIQEGERQAQLRTMPAGAQTRAPRKCSMCESLEHTARTCPKRQRTN
ncbi:hypothetical protein K469DRAFT_712195 [Zopfia rhizophila CBS 207.26]|uniref:CCHC-type domain-containing protein n=1 Tax=Zopfia rhizophila CBS 207.26 TaxID=1314779 RepID=A0A6A6EQX8_9PEZI|nr:hypothetical protein K469DRAFT_712195 [Zopfia rhizophila CBS 207.26]